MRRSTAAFLLLAVVASRPAMGTEHGPVCREPSVVEEIAREVRTRSYFGEVDPRLVTEMPTADPTLVRCDVCVQSAPYNTTRSGDQPVPRCVPRGFEVKILPGGFVVRALR